MILAAICSVLRKDDSSCIRLLGFFNASSKDWERKNIVYNWRYFIQFGSSGDSTTFSMTCTYSGTSGQTVSASIDAMFAVGGGVAHEVSGSPATYTFTIETT